jgi:Cu(I)/Ag(I) efflux system membrane fusion protein
MNRYAKVIRIAAGIAVAGTVLLVAAHYRVGVATWVLASSAVQSSHDHPADKSALGEKKILYWYDAMNPALHSDKPGKAPDGMDLVPKYADSEPSSAGHSGHPTAGVPAAASEKKILYWYDGMNPAMRSDKPGKAPDGMDLVPMYADAERSMAEVPPGTVKISSTKQQLIGVRTDTVKRESLKRTIRAVAQVQIDETKIARIHVKIAGWVEKVQVDFIGKLVRKDQPLFSLYSPDLVATQQEYLIARRAEKDLASAPFQEVSRGAETLLEAARQRLRLWDMNDEQIRQLDETGEVSRTTTMYSPIDGFVLKREVFERSYITPETELYEIADFSTVWVNAEIYEYEVPYVKVGQSAQMTLSYFPGKTYTGNIVYIYPTVDPMTRTVKVRLEFRNPNFQLKPDMFADVQLNIGYGTQTVVPQEAVLDSGSEQIVFVATGDGYFEPRKVQLGPRLEDRVVVLSGLQAGETIVTSGNFLIDSESRLKNAMAGMKH